MISLKTWQNAILYILIFTLGLVSCREQCDNANTNLIKVKFFNASTLEEDTLAFNRVQGITDPVIADEAVLFDTTQSLTTFELPTSSLNDQVSFLFEQGSGNKLVQDTISFTYSRTLELIQPNCGVTEIISSLGILRHTFDSAAVVSDVLSNQVNQVNVHVFIQN